jgi:hypothetical protein
MLWLIGILSSCGSYHKLKNINGNYKTVLESENKNDSKVYFVHTNNEVFQIEQPNIKSDILTGLIIPTDEVELSFYKEAKSNYPKFILKNSLDLADSKKSYQEGKVYIDSFQMSKIDVSEVKANKIKQQIHIHTTKYSKSGTQISIKLSDISDMKILKKSLKKSANNVVIVILTVILVIGALIGLLLLLIVFPLLKAFKVVMFPEDADIVVTEETFKSYLLYKPSY